MYSTMKEDLEKALKKLMLTKPLNKITISDLTRECHISRMAFYYHFSDIYALVEWACLEDARKALQGKKTVDTWQEGFLQLFEAIDENRPFILNAYRCIAREQIEAFLYSVTYDLLSDVLREQSAPYHLDQADEDFIAQFYKYSFVGFVLDWIKNGMKEDYTQIVSRLGVIMNHAFSHSLEAFSRRP